MDMPEKPKETPPHRPTEPDRYGPDMNPSFANIPAEAEQPTGAERFGQASWEIIKTLGFILLAAFILKFFVVTPFIVDGESMEPTYQDGQYLLVNQLSYRFGKPHRGDVVIFKAPPEPSENYIKRIVGMPGETVELRDGALYLYNDQHRGGVKLSEPYTESGQRTLSESEQNRWELGPDQYFVAGDNRGPGKSSDSRAWGPVPRSNFIGKTWVRVYPPADFSLLKHQKPFDRDGATVSFDFLR